MPDMEKVIRGLTACRKTICKSCPYNASGKEDINPICFINEMISDALELLKAQRETIDELISAGKALKLLKEQEIGHWIFLENCSNSGVYCSECQTKVFDNYPFKKKFSYFCPHCGARMEGETERR